MSKLPSLEANTYSCKVCDEDMNPERWYLGFRVCLTCGEKQARTVKHTIVPLPKSNYIVVTDRSLLLGLNSSHKGGGKL